LTPVRSLRVLYVVGARPNFVKVAPVVAAGEAWNAAALPSDLRFDQTLVHTGQHYDAALSDVFFEQLGLPEPDVFLGVGSGTQAVQTARLLEALEPVVLEHRPDLVVVPGDVNSTLAAALVAAKLHVPVAHLEAGLRSGDKEMPEELNRIVADHCADLLFTTCADADENLAREGIAGDKVILVGNTMIDTLVRLLPLAREREAAARAAVGVEDGPLVLVTLHRPSNVDDPAQLERLLGMLAAVADDVPVVFPVHPRTRATLQSLSLVGRPGFRIVDPLGYLEFVALMCAAAVVVTDSGGVQEETSALGVPCVTVRTTTERPVTCALGTNRLCDPADAEGIREAVAEGRGSTCTTAQIPLWDGRAAERVIGALAEWGRGRLSAQEGAASCAK
jgi:UDP-N-acetylglucosamine 2-epimerase (non-hydrolysing)